ncbi:hypothetical protein HHI36_016774 [Cryptolaemus montrouzieri]|uniref:MORN repeat-containing protein 5 n=1 Tax=Cryptolaemus montrouzieri TaxID=559131 RepID=A0ABD2NKN6_9CUCU
MTYLLGSSLPSTKRRLTRDWHTIFVEDEPEARYSKCTTRRKTLVDEVWIESNVDLHNLVYTEIDYLTGSSYEGQFSKVGMEGVGTFTFPHGVVYEGQFRDGMFHGKGLLIYPQGQALNCTFKMGKMTQWEFLFSPPSVINVGDITVTETRRVSPISEHDEFMKMKKDEDLDISTYCQPLDRRFYRCYLQDLVGAPEEILTDDPDTKEIPEGCYDTEDGFYNPRTKWVHNYKDTNDPLYMAPEMSQILNLGTRKARRNFEENFPNVPVYQTENWILEHCRKAGDQNVGYKPELYEYWFSGRECERKKLQMRSTKQGGKFDIKESACQNGLKLYEKKTDDILHH